MATADLAETLDETELPIDLDNSDFDDDEEERLYTFQQLIDENCPGLDKARAQLIRWGTEDNFWAECVIEEWQALLERIGFEKPEINYCGFWSQGDGASFTATVDVPKLVAFLDTLGKASPADYNHVAALADQMERVAAFDHFSGMFGAPRPQFEAIAGNEDLSIWLNRTSSREVHEYSVDVEYVFDEWPNYSRELFQAFRDRIEEVRLQLSKVIYRALEESYKARCEDEGLSEEAEANDWKFTEDGEFVEGEGEE